jgi:hypothetical protein
MKLLLLNAIYKRKITILNLTITCGPRKALGQTQTNYSWQAGDLSANPTPGVTQARQTSGIIAQGDHTVNK